jgi:predicted CXXCH cytochrome family protein
LWLVACGAFSTTDPSEDPVSPGAGASPVEAEGEETGPPTADVAAAPCATCHPEAVAAWTGSHHALAERPFDAADPANAWAVALEAERLIGVDPVIQALVPAEGGRLQAHSLALDPNPGDADPRFSIFDDPREPGDWGHWTGGALTWNGRCAVCHNTGVDKGYVEVASEVGAYETTMDAIGIGCAACHGDASNHAAGGAAPENARMEDTCASCHARRAELTGEFAPGDAFLDHFLPVFLDDAAVFAADGRAVDEAFEWMGFVSSAMHAGGARCGDCHDPHSGVLLREGDALCTSCHAADGIGVGHAPMEGACVDCHMPELTLMGRHARRDHGFTRPDDARPQVAAFERARMGQGFTDLDLSVAPRGRRASHVAALGRYPSDPAARTALIGALDDGDPLVRTAAASALVAADPGSQTALETAAEDPVRAVRVGAQRALVEAGRPLSDAPDFLAYLNHNADDPRVRSDRGAARLAAGDPGGLSDLAAAVALDPAAPELVGRQAVGLATVGRPRAALEVLEAGAKRFPDDLGIAERLGLARAGAGQLEAAATALQSVVERDPTRVRAWRNLALLNARLGRMERAIRAADEALALEDDPELRAWRAGLDR